MNALTNVGNLRPAPRMESQARPITLREADLYGLLRSAIAAAGSQEAWARATGLASSFVSDTMTGKRPFSDRMLAALGVRRVTTYHLLDPAGDATDAERILAALNRTDRRALLWLTASGARRKRGDKKDGEWRPLLADLRRLRALRLVEETPEGWAATAAGISARAALVAALEKGGGAENA